MTLATLDHKELTRLCGTEVPEILVVVAKHEVLDIDSKTIAELLGVTQGEIEELQKDGTYQKVLLLLKSSASQARVDTELGYDALEQLAVNRLLERVPFERDADFLLKVATMANRATRRTKGPTPLDPSQAGTRVPITLTQRFVRKVASDGGQEVIEERQVRLNGNHTNPTFADVDSLFNVTTKPYLDKPMEVKTQSVEPTVDDLMRGLDN